MLQIIIKGIMEIIVTIMNLIFTPILGAIFALFPDLGTMFTYITNFLAQAIVYVGTILQWFLFSPSMFAMLFDYFIIKYSIHLIIIGIKFAINMYNKLKP